MGRAEQAGWLVGWLDKTVEHVSGFLSYISHDFASKATAPSSPPGRPYKPSTTMAPLEQDRAGQKSQESS